MGRKIPPTKKSPAQNNASDVTANNILTRQTATEKELLKRVANLEKIVEKLQSELYVTKTVNTLLSNAIMIYSSTRDEIVLSSMDYALHQLRPAIKSPKKRKKCGQKPFSSIQRK